MVTLYSTFVTCPECSGRFVTDHLAIARPMTARSSDLRSIHEGLSPLSFLVTACPHCHVSFFHEGDYLKMLADDQKTAVIDEARTLCAELRGRSLNEKPLKIPTIFNSLLACSIAESLLLQAETLAYFWHLAS